MCSSNSHKCFFIHSGTTLKYYCVCISFHIIPLYCNISTASQVPIERKKKYVMIRKEVSGENRGKKVLLW